MSAHVKEEATEGAGGDQKMFSRLQIKIDNLKEEIKSLRKLQNPIRKRLRKHMQDEDLESLQCGEFVLTQEIPNDDEDPGIIFNEKKVTSFFDEDQIASYVNDPQNQRKPRKRPRFTCERQVVDLASGSGSDSDSDSDSGSDSGSDSSS